MNTGIHQESATWNGRGAASTAGWMIQCPCAERTHGPAVIGDLEREARNHAKVRYLLSATWGRDHIDPGVWERLVIAVSPGPVMDGDARTPAAALHDKILNEAGVGALLAAPMA